MKRLLSILLIAAGALGARAATSLLPGSVDFSSPSLWGKTVAWGLDDAGDTNNPSATYWYLSSDAAGGASVERMAGRAAGHLVVDTDGKVNRTISVSLPSGPTASQTTEYALYFDSSVRLSETVHRSYPGITDEDKVIFWLYRPEDADTSETPTLMIACGETNGLGEVVGTTNVLTTTRASSSKDCRLTVRAINVGGVTGFHVWIDGEEVEAEDGATFFPSRVQDSQVSSIGFSGHGQAGHVNFTRVNPLENEDYDKVDLSMLREATTITFSGYDESAKPQYNCPALVRISPERISRFTYDRTAENGSDLRFTDENGKLIPYEIDTWNTNGESLVWVKVPYLYRGTTIHMHWNRTPGTYITGSGSDGQSVWSDYSGVWHFGEEILTDEDAATVCSKDSTGNGYCAVPTGGVNAILTEMKSTSGAIGRARLSAVDNSLRNGNGLLLQDTEDLKLGDTFMLSTWMNLSGTTGASNPRVISRKDGSTDANGFDIGVESNVRVFARGAGSSYVMAPVSAVGLWAHVTYTYAGNTIVVTTQYRDGETTVSTSVTNTVDAAATDNDKPIMIGNTLKFGWASLSAAIDEFRIRRVSSLAESIELSDNEFNQIARDDFATCSPAVTRGTYNFWIREPAFMLDGKRVISWTVEDAPSVTFVEGIPYYGVIFRTYYDKDGNVLPECPPLDSPGTYRAVFTAKDGIHDELVSDITFSIYEPLGYTQISGYDRVMLFNDDLASNAVVRLQGYRDVDVNTNRVWNSTGAEWDDPELYPFIVQGTTHTYSDPVTGRVLWRFEHARLGNLFADGDKPYTSIHYLPWSSPTARRFDDSEKHMSLARYAGTLVLQNVSILDDPDSPAAAYSPVYTNGIGAVYFDAVNAHAGYSGALRVQVRHGEGEWEDVKSEICRIEDGATVSVSNSVDVVLDMGRGGTADAFFRVRAKMDDVSDDASVRIVRTDDDSTARQEGGEDGEGLIVIDNIVVSPPASGVEISQYGRAADESNALLRGQWLGGFDVPYPGAGDQVHARLKVHFVVSGTNRIDTSTVPSAILTGRWRYLNQDVGAWRDYALLPSADDPTCYVSRDELPFDEVGDFEYRYQVICNAPFYIHHDYANLEGWGWPGGDGERRGDRAIRAQDDGIYTGELSPALGNDYFLRLRDGRSDVESVDLVLGGVRGDTVAMKLVTDHVWRGLVLATNSTGAITFFFRECRNLLNPRAYETVTNDYFAKADAAVPSFGESTTNGVPTSFAADGATHYVEFRYNDETHEFSTSHAEYQDFNRWHDASRSGALFVGRYTETSGVNVAQMTVTNANIASWPLMTVTNENWNENFYLSNYMDPGYPKGETFREHKMPHSWYGAFGQFTDQTFVNDGLSRTNSSGIAWQMQGNEYGEVYYNGSSVPTGVDKVSFQAHLAQSIDFNDFSVWSGDGANVAENYTFFVPALMSDNDCKDLAPGAAMSLVGYYRRDVGCYELRVEKIFNESKTYSYHFSIYKWCEKDYSIQPELLGTSKFTAKFSNQTTSTKPKMYGFFLSVGEDPKFPGATTIIGGLHKYNDTLPTDPTAYTKRTYGFLCCVDTNSILQTELPPRHTCGAFGVLTKNCAGQFLNLGHYDENLKWDSLLSGVTPRSGTHCGEWTKLVTFTGSYVSDTDKVTKESWDTVPGRIERFTTSLYDTVERVGLRTPLDVEQTVDVLIKPKDSSEWTCVTNIDVTGYGFKRYEASVKEATDATVRLRAGKKTTDVTVWDIVQTAWRGEDIEDIDGKSSDFVYTQACIVDETEGKYTFRRAKLQPSRALASKPLSIRSPILKGLGMIGFSYRDVQPGCEVWVQMSTNHVSANLSALNKSLTEGQAAGEWETLKKFTYEELVQGQSYLSVYTGFHTDAKDPNALRGVYRLLISPEVVGQASPADPEYGSITITDVEVHDEPGIDTNAWWGWNLRAVGDSMDSEGRMYLPDGRLANAPNSEAHGFSGALNNSTYQDITGDPEEFKKNNPFFQSPTFGGYESSPGVTNSGYIGIVRFRARLYDRSATQPGHVSIYGVYDGNTTDWGTPLTNLVVDSYAFKEYEFRATGKHKRFAAVRLMIDGVVGTPLPDAPQRVLIDEIVLTEKSNAALSFAYARPFRTGLRNDGVITDILTREQQPLCGESWGVQTKLNLQRLGNEVDTNRGIRVTFQYFVGSIPWGYDNWLKSAEASEEVELKQVGNHSDFVFRSTLVDPDYRNTVVKAIDTPAQVVQYMVTAYYYALGGKDEESQTIAWSKAEGDGWTNPSWYAPIDHNDSRAEKSGSYSPYTILDTVSPGRAWINEVNFNDGRAEENGGEVPTKNQFIELAVPSGIDMSGWNVRVTDRRHNTFTIALLGLGMPSRKGPTAQKSGDYEFYVIQSPDAQEAGTFGDMADGTWTDQTMSDQFEKGAFRYNNPYEIALYRPSGTLEHQVVIQGTNIYSKYSYGYQYEGTNLVYELQGTTPETEHFFAGEDVKRWTNGTDLASIGVTTNGHGEAGNWATMPFTVGRLNAGQEPLTDWYLRPNGSNVWVYAKAFGDHIVQRIGDESAPDMFAIVPAGGSTNIVYTFMSPWYEMGDLTVNGVTNTAAKGARPTYELKLTDLHGDVEVIANETVRADLGLDPNDPYTPAVINWLENGYADGKPFQNDDVNTNNYQEALPSGTVDTMGLKMLYWFDIDPTIGNWWLRHGITDYTGRKIYRKDEENNIIYTNFSVQVTMYLSNDVTGVVHAPKRLQGLGGEQSDTYAGAWTSVNFKVLADLRNGLDEHRKPYLPFRWFSFDGDSFYPSTSVDPLNPPYSARIEILDPFCPSSPGWSYGWYGQGMYPVWFSYGLDSEINYSTVEKLNKDSTYKNVWPEIDP